MSVQARPRLVVGITIATGVIFGVRLLEPLKGSEIETHLVVSKWASRTLIHETSYTVEQVKRLAAFGYPVTDLRTVLSSGLFITRGMVVAPCSTRTLAAIAQGGSDN